MKLKRTLSLSLNTRSSIAVPNLAAMLINGVQATGSILRLVGPEDTVQLQVAFEFTIVVAVELQAGVTC